MSRRYKGGVISATPPTTTGGTSGTAVGVWTMKDQVQKQGMSIWPIANNFWIGLITGSTNQGYEITTDSSGNVYTVGSSDVSGRDIQIIKYNFLGVIQWQRSLGSTSSFYADGWGINVDSSGNVYVSGSSDYAGGSGALIVAKYNSSGSLQWQRYAKDTLTAIGASVDVDSSGNVYVVGSTGLTIGEDDLQRLTIVKYNSSGTLQWVRRMQDTGSSSTEGWGVFLDSSGNPHVCGYRSSGGSYLIAKYNSSGTIQWQVQLAASNSPAYSIALDSSSNIYIAGQGPGASAADLFLVKYNSSGTLQWQRRIGGANTDVAYYVSTDSSGNVYITGYGLSEAAVSYCYIVKYDSSGTIQFQRRFFSASVSTYGYGIKIDSNNIMNVVGYSNVGGAAKAFILKLPNDGSKTGTYSVAGYNFTYEASSLTGATPTLSSSTTTLTNETATLTNGTSTLTDAASSLTASVTAI